MFLNNLFQKFDHLPASGKNVPSRISPPNFYCLHQRLILSLNNNFHVINKIKFHF